VKPQGRDRHETRPAGVGRNKALRACETLRGHVLGGWSPPGQVAARFREDAEGERTAGEEAVGRGNPTNGGAGAIRLWRGAKGYERMARGKKFPRAGRRGEDLTGQPQGEGQRGSGKPITTLAPST